MKISAIIITRDEEHTIADCLASLDFAAEIVVVDSGSTDRTREICEQNPRVRFYVSPWEGFGVQKNRALDLATGDWIFSIDADETVTPELAAEILRTLQRPACDGYTVKRKNIYREQWVRHSGWWPDRILRLFRKGRGRFSDRLVHETVVLEGAPGRLDNCIEHRSFRNAGDFFRKGESYSTLGARTMVARGERTSAMNALFRSTLTFFKTLVIKRGFLDGSTGVLIAFSNAMGVFYRHMKCLELQSERHDSHT
ncbi:MAG TPA: glycosyltransferase family 2 protein [Desulfuromonadaceae bacterium]